MLHPRLPRLDHPESNPAPKSKELDMTHKAAAATEQDGEPVAVKGHEIASGQRSECSGPAPGEPVRSGQPTSQEEPPSS